MKKGQIIEGTVERIDFPNKGIVVCEEGTCTVKNALPGQKVRVVVNKARNSRYEGRLLEVLAPAPAQIAPPCPHYGICGGCTYLSFPYEESLAIKEGQVKRLLLPVLASQKTPCQFEQIKGSPRIFGYRNKMEFTFGDEVKDGPLSLGMHKRGSFYDIVSVTDCQIVDGDYRKIITCVKDYFAGRQSKGVNITFYHRLRHSGYLRHLLVRKGAKTGEILIALVTASQAGGGFAVGNAEYAEGMSAAGNAESACETGTLAGKGGGVLQEQELLEGLKRELLRLSLDGKIVGILHIVNDSPADVVRSDETRLLYGQDHFYEELLGLRFKISPFSFFQTNSLGAEVLYGTAREYIGGYIRAGRDDAAVERTCCESGAAGEQEKGMTVFDLYSGTGTIAQMLAPVAKKVIGVEIVEEAVEAARRNAELNGLHNCEFIAGDVLKALDEIEQKPDIIILDPPRDGVHPKALRKIIGYGVEHILYISCKVSSLARDLEAFLAGGYEARRCVAIDQFPWTTGIEVVILLAKREGSG